MGAEFLYRPGIADLDFIADLGVFLLDIGYITESMAPALFVYDTGEMEWEPDGQGGSILEVLPNDIPDAVELRLLQYVLQDAQFDMISTGGASHIHTWKSWEVNLALAQSEINNSELGYLARLVAAYMTIGTPGHRAAIKKLVQENYSITLDLSASDTSVSSWFGPEGDVDNDGVWNIEEWENVEEVLSGTVTPGELVDETAESATDPDDTYTPPPPQGGTFVYDGEAMTVGSTEHAALIEDATGANGPLIKGSITFVDNGLLKINAVIIDPSGFDTVPMPVGSAVTCALGRKFRITVDGDLRWFEEWNVPDTLVDGSDSTSETFIFGNASQLVQPASRPEGAITVGAYGEWSGVGPLADAIWTSTSPQGTVLHVAKGTYVRLSVSDTAPALEDCNPFLPDASQRWGWQLEQDVKALTPIITVRAAGGVATPSKYCSRPIWPRPLAGDGGVRLFGMTGMPYYDYQSGLIVGCIPDIGPYPDATGFSDDFVFDLETAPGFQVETITRPASGTVCETDIFNVMAYGYYTGWATLATGAGGASASSIRMSELKVDCKTKPGDQPGGWIDADKKSHGTTTWSAIRKFLTRETLCHENTELIKLTAVPQNGYNFLRWYGEGDWMDAGGNLNP